MIKNASKKPRLGVEEESFEESLGAIAALIKQHEEVPLEDPGPGCSRDVSIDLAGGRENHGNPEPPDETSKGVVKLPGGGDQHEGVPLVDTGFHDDVSHEDQEHVGNEDGQGSPRPSQ